MQISLKQWIGAAVAAIVLAGCASPYGPQGSRGGFQEQKLGPNTYRVSYNGNGYTDEDQVVYYWLYRCAELTHENGYSYFGVLPENRSSSQPDNGEVKRMAVYRPGDDAPGAVKIRGGSFVYIPNFYTYTIRTWHKRGTIVMYHSRVGAFTQEQAYALHAGTVLEKLRGYVKDGQRADVPSRREVIDAAMRHIPGFSGGAVQDLPEATVSPAQ